MGTVPPPQAGQPARPHPQAPFHPTSDQATYRDLLLFEERLKMNAEMLRKRRRRYNAFLWIFISLLIAMAYRLMLTPPRRLSPQNPFLLRALQASLTVVFMTLALFFASGMYEEKIRYAHSYITHSNKALRPLNMYLNMRLPRFSILSYIPWYDPSPPVPTAPIPAPTKPTAAKLTRRQSTNTVMATIPTSSNPRGELIFSSRVDKTFREGYERYRAAFERRREEKQKEERGRGWKMMLPWARLDSSTPISAVPTPPGSRKGTPPPGSSFGSVGRGGRAPSPGVLRGSGLRSDEKLDWGSASVVEGKTEKPPLGERGRSDSYSFVLAGPGSKEPALRPNR